MLVLFETPAGYALFKMTKDAILKDPDSVHDKFATPEKAAEAIKLKAFMTFENTADAVAASTDMIDSKMGKSLKKFLTKNIIKKEVKDKLAVSDSKLANSIKDKLSIKCVNDSGVMELMRGIRGQLEGLLSSVGENNMRAMRLGLSHSLSRYKLKFSADKVDTMIVQAIGLLDELDKEINTYSMRVKEWFGWHFPEMAKIVNDNILYARVVIKMGVRTECKNCDFSDILEDEDMVNDLKEAAELSMGTEITITDIISIKALADQVVALAEYRLQLAEYLRSRMQAIAPNLTIMVGELVGARLIAHAGSLINLAKQPASTVQILGAEKALFRALKSKHDTPKYGLIYHASLIGQAAPKNKGKISRVLAAKCALAIRVDALADETDTTIGLESRTKVESRLRQMDGNAHLIEAAPKTPTQVKKYDSKAAIAGTPKPYSTGEDMVVVKKEEEVEELEIVESSKKRKKEKKEKSAKKEKKEKKRKAAAAEQQENGAASSSDDGVSGTDNGAVQVKDEDMTENGVEQSSKKKKKRKSKASDEDAEDEGADEDEGSKSSKKKKKKRKSLEVAPAKGDSKDKKKKKKSKA